MPGTLHGLHATKAGESLDDGSPLFPATRNAMSPTVSFLRRKLPAVATLSTAGIDLSSSAIGPAVGSAFQSSMRGRSSSPVRIR